MSDDEIGVELGYVGGPAPTAQFPKTFARGQGRRKKDRWGPCTLCGTPGAFRCHRCKKWRCWACIAVRKVPGAVGLYFVRCRPRCVHRRKPEVIALVKKFTREPRD